MADGPPCERDALRREWLGSLGTSPARELFRGSLEAIRRFRETVRERRREFERLVLAEAMLDDASREEPACDAPPDVVTRRNRQECARVVVETRGVREARGLDGLLEEAQHALEAVVEPPWRSESQRRVTAGERREFARIARLVEREQDDREVARVAYVVEQRLQCLDVVRAHRNVGALVAAERAEQRRIVIAEA